MSLPDPLVTFGSSAGGMRTFTPLECGREETDGHGNVANQHTKYPYHPPFIMKADWSIEYLPDRQALDKAQAANRVRKSRQKKSQ